MLKLSGTGGKFDIVFDSNPDFDESAKLSGNRATSAGRRKNKEWKSKVLPKKDPKEPHYKNVKISKTTELRNSTIAKKYNQTKKTDKSPKPAVIPENEIVRSSKIPRKEKKSTVVKDKKNTHPPAAEKKKEFSRKATYVFEDDNGGEIIITKEQLQAIQRDLRKDEEVAPTNVPGLDLQSPTTKHEQLDSSHDTSGNTLDTSREDEIRRLQARPVEIYDPWGKPGAGAPTSTEDGKVRTHRNVRMLQSEKEGYKQMQQSFESPEREKSPVIANYDTNTDHVPKPSVHARGKGKQAHEISDLEKKKAKHYEHQQAIAAQGEEKRLQKQREKEQKIRDDQEAEERYKKQQEIVRKRLEDEQLKEKEKQEAKLMKQKMLEEGIRKAEEEAKRAKEEARKARSRPQPKEQKGGGEPDLSVMSPKYKRVLHGDNDRIGPSKSYEEESVLEDFSQFYKDDDEPSMRSTKQRNVRASKDTYRMKSPDVKRQSISPRVTSDEKRDQIVDDYLVPYHRTETAEMYDNHQQENTIEQQKRRRKKKEKTPVPVPSDSEDEPRPVKPKTKSKQKATKSRSPAPVRSNRPTSWTQQDQFEQAPMGSPSTKRQQEILDRLAELRMGLKQKERECYEATWSR